MKSLVAKVIILAIVSVFFSCKKFLDEKPEQGLHVPSTIEDFQALLDNYIQMNGPSGNSLIELLSDNYYVTYTDWQNSNLQEKAGYIWDSNMQDLANWSAPYAGRIYYSNIILDNINRVPITEQSKAIEGAALFFRAFSFYNIAELYCKPYTTTSSEDPGIVLRQTAAVEAKVNRASVKDTYMKILADLKRAADILPENSITNTRPNRIAAYALIARIYLSMREYDNALMYTDMALAKRNELLDFNNLTFFPQFIANREILFFTVLQESTMTGQIIAKIDSNIYNSFHSDDLRKTLYFTANAGNNSYSFKGSYYTRFGGGGVFTGLAVDELYLIRAECLARKGDFVSAMKSLNALLLKRWRSGKFIEKVASNGEEAKEIVLEERRKELIFRGTRWSDLRRLNLEGNNITLKRVLNGIVHTLPPNDQRWVMLIPDDEITRSGIPQNPR